MTMWTAFGEHLNLRFGRAALHAVVGAAQLPSICPPLCRAGGRDVTGIKLANHPAHGCRIRRDAGRLERRLASFLQYKLRAPPLLLTVIFSVRPRTYLLFLLWVICCPIAARFEVSLIAALLTLFYDRCSSTYVASHAPCC